MRRTRTVSLSGVLVAVVLSLPAAGQEAVAEQEVVEVQEVAARDSPRSGLWGGFGFGYGSLGCDGCDDRIDGFSGMGVIGGTLSDVVRIGGGTSFFTREEDDATLTIGSGLFIIQVFPGRGNFYLQGGAGFATAEVELLDEDFTDEGAAFLIGLGYTANLGESRKLAIVPFANWMGTSLGPDLELFQLGVGLVWN